MLRRQGRRCGTAHLQRRADSSGRQHAGAKRQGQDSCLRAARRDLGHRDILRGGSQAKGVLVELHHELVQGALAPVVEVQLVHCRQHAEIWMLLSGCCTAGRGHYTAGSTQATSARQVTLGFHGHRVLVGLMLIPLPARLLGQAHVQQTPQAACTPS